MDDWTQEQREFCVEQYYLNQGLTAAVRRLFCKQFRVGTGGMRDKCPGAGKIRQWVRIHEGHPPGVESDSVPFRSLFHMDRQQNPRHLDWTKEQREFCVEQFYSNHCLTVAVRRLYCEKFNVKSRDIKLKCPSAEQIKEWAIKYEPKKTVPQETEPNKLIGSQWGRKTGENRILRTESVSSDMGLEHQAIKWKQRDIKWSGPRPVDKKEKIPVPIPVKPNYYYYHYQPPPPVVEVKPDKRQVMQEKFEQKLYEQVESLEADGHAARASAFVSLRAELQRRAVNGLLDAHRATLADHVSRALRRGKDAERKAAAAVAPLLALQVCEENMEDFFRKVRPALSATATDKSVSLETRIECCSSLAVLCYLVEDDLIEILEVMRMYETIFSGSYLKDDGSVNVSASAVEKGALHAAALDGWALLLPVLPPNHALSLLNNQEPSFARLGEMLEVVSVEVRLAAGAALAIAYETVSDDDNSDNALTSHVDILLPLLTELAQDSNRFRSKNDLRIQRATFRDILMYFEEGSVPSMSVRIGSETASWSSWSGGAAYAALAGALGGALQVLAPRDGRLRAALALSDTLPEEMEPQEKPKKLQRHLKNRATSKARNLTRSQNRDKRSAGLVN